MELFKLVYDKDKCCGCGLCASKCPRNAIEMKEDEYGFVFPYINKEKCINCGICKKICSYNKKNEISDFKKITYASFSKQKNILNTTASGGIFTSIASEFIKQNGIVFGCTLKKENNKFEIKHIKVENEKDLEKLKGSKYVQSDITNIFNEIQKCLKENKKVLFSGTPCQVSAIKTFTNNPNNLYTIDIICHGVPNNKMFNDYISYENKKNNIKIENFKFRDKYKGWGLIYLYSYEYNNNKKIEPAFKSSYYQLFLDAKIHRENCYNCPYANENRISDITIGDYWGIENEHPELIKNNVINSKKGVSCIIINSNKGLKLLKKCDKYLNLFESDFNKVKKHNKQLNNPANKNDERKIILEKYKNNNYEAINNYYWKKNIIKIFIKNIYFKIPNIIRKKIRK